MIAVKDKNLTTLRNFKLELLNWYFLDVFINKA